MGKPNGPREPVQGSWPDQEGGGSEQPDLRAELQSGTEAIGTLCSRPQAPPSSSGLAQHRAQGCQLPQPYIQTLSAPCPPSPKHGPVLLHLECATGSFLNGTHSSTLAWKIPRTEEPGRLQSMGSLELDTTERLHFHFSLSCIGEGNGNPLQCSCLENPRDGGAWWAAAIYGVAQSRTQLKRLSSSSSTSKTDEPM